MKEKEFRLLTEKGILVIPDYSSPDLPTKAEQNMRVVLEVELAKNFGVVLLKNQGITDEFVMWFLGELEKEGKLMTQPFFPQIIPVDKDGVEVRDLVRGKLIEGFAVERSDLKRRIADLKNPDPLALSWLGDELKEGLNQAMIKFTTEFLKDGKIKATRKNRKELMKVLEYYVTAKPEPLILESYWKRLALWVHPSDYPEFPKAQKFLFGILKTGKEEPEKPKLKKLMWKGWKEGKDFDVFESYIDQPGLTPTDLLKSMRDYERDPRVSRWKKTEGVELGKEKPGEEETEVVDLMLLQLKEKLLGMIKPKKANLKILPSFYKVPAHYLLKCPLVIAENVLPEEVCGFRIAVSKNEHLITYNLEGGYSDNNEWNHLEDCLDFFIVGYKMDGWNGMINLVFLGSNSEVVDRAEIRVSQEVRSLILFGYDSSTRTLKWIGEPSKTFYAGKPDGIKDWKRVWDVLMKRKTVLSLGELAEKMYDNQEGREFEPEDLTIERMRRDLK